MSDGVCGALAGRSYERSPFDPDPEGELVGVVDPLEVHSRMPSTSRHVPVDDPDPLVEPVPDVLGVPAVPVALPPEPGGGEVVVGAGFVAGFVEDSFDDEDVTPGMVFRPFENIDAGEAEDGSLPARTSRRIAGICEVTASK